MEAQNSIDMNRVVPIAGGCKLVGGQKLMEFDTIRLSSRKNRLDAIMLRRTISIGFMTFCYFLSVWISLFR